MNQVRSLLAAAQARGVHGSISHSTGDDEDDPDYLPSDVDELDEFSYIPWSRHRHQASYKFQPFTEPQKAGVELLNSGEFGRIGAKKIVNIRRKLKDREMGHNGRRKGLERDFVRVSKSHFVCRRMSLYGLPPSIRTSHPIGTAQLSPITLATLILVNILRASYLHACVLQVSHREMLFADSSFYYTCCQGSEQCFYFQHCYEGLTTNTSRLASPCLRYKGSIRFYDQGPREEDFRAVAYFHSRP